MLPLRDSTQHTMSMAGVCPSSIWMLLWQCAIDKDNILRLWAQQVSRCNLAILTSVLNVPWARLWWLPKEPQIGHKSSSDQSPLVCHGEELFCTFGVIFSFLRLILSGVRVHFTSKAVKEECSGLKEPIVLICYYNANSKAKPWIHATVCSFKEDHRNPVNPSEDISSPVFCKYSEKE